MNLFTNETSLFRKAIRRLLAGMLPPEFQMPIWLGPLRGKRWVVGSFINKCWLGIYENEKQKRFADEVDLGQVVYDIGANVGYYTLLASILVGPKGKVIAFEPLPRNLAFLRTHLKINNLKNVQIIDSAISDTKGEMFFSTDTHHAMGHISQDGSLRVKVVSLDEIVTNLGLPKPDVLKIDIEGAEYEALIGAEEQLRRHHPMIFLATHGTEVHHQCCAYLTELGYALEAIDGKLVANTDELVAIFSSESVA